MATVYNLTADLCPVPIVPGAPLTIGDETPTTYTALVADASGSGSLVSPMNQNAVRSDLIGRGGAGAYAVVWGSGADDTTPGLELTVDSGLDLLIGVGTAMLDGPVQVTAPLTVSLTDDTAPGYVYLSQAGAAVVVNEDLTPPAGPHVYLGAVTTASGSITEIDGSGVLYLLGGVPIRQSADTGCPADTPPAALALLTQCPGGLYLWDGTQYRNCSASGRAGIEYPSDANYTATAAESTCAFLDLLASGATLGAQRDLVLPLLPEGRSWTIRNATDGGQDIQAIGATGTGVVIGTGKTAVVLSDGTDILRVTADI
jgi:hypothetical protein